MVAVSEYRTTITFGRSCFEFFDYITLDDGEVPVEELINAIENPTYNSFKEHFFLKMQSGL
jgi:hypothetical protein